jgi:hypothetical protein
MAVDLSRYILFALAARQDGLLRDLQRMQIGDANIRPLIANIESTRAAAASCINDLAARAQRPLTLARLTLQDRTALFMDYQNLCPSAILYRTGQAPHSQLASISRNGAKSTCHHCGVIIGASKISIPGADASSCVLMDLSGFFRAHCRDGGGWTCIWQLRVPSCYGVFQNEKALLKHMLAVHVRDDRGPVNVKVVDWPADIRQGNLQKCGYSVRINGLQMRVCGGNLVVPRRVGAIGRTVSSQSSSMSDASTAATDLSYSESSASSVTAVERDAPESEQQHEMGSDEIFEMFV